MYIRDEGILTFLCWLLRRAPSVPPCLGRWLPLQWLTDDTPTTKNKYRKFLLLFLNFSPYLTLVPPTLLCSENQDPEALHNVKLYYGGDGEYLFRLMICPEMKHFL